MILTGRNIWRRRIITPHVSEPGRAFGRSYGESQAGYDIRLGEAVELTPEDNRPPFGLGVSLENFDMPKDVQGEVKDKSTNIRLGLFVGNTVIEPGWQGWLTLEIVAIRPIQVGAGHDVLPAGFPIAQVVFSQLTKPVAGYDGKYQRQPNRPVEAILEGP